MKQMFDISEKLLAEQSDEIYGINTISWKTLHGSIYLWLVMKKSSVSCTQRPTYFQIMYYALERWTRNPQSNIVWEDRLTWFKSSPEYRALDKIEGQPMEFEWNIFPGFTTLQQSPRVNVKIERTTRKFHWTDYLHVDVQRHLIGIWRQWTGMQC